MPRVTVIIPVYNDPERLKLCLDALRGQTAPADSFEVVVVDNGSEAPPRGLVEGYDGWRMLEESRPGSYAARNRAIAETDSELLAFTDSDCIPEPDWLERLVARLDADPDAACVGGHVEIFPADPDRPNSIELYDGIFGMPQDSGIELCHFSATANMATRRSVVDRAGPFDADLKSGGDVEWGQRLQEFGLSVVYEPAAVVRHPARSKWADILRQARRHAGGRHDMKREGGYSYLRLHFVWAVMRMVFPRPKNLVRIAKHKSITGPIRWTRVVAVMMALRWTQVLERLRLLVGRGSERR